MQVTIPWRAPRSRRRAGDGTPPPGADGAASSTGHSHCSPCVLTGCPVGPNFVPPQPEMPPTYRSELEPVQAASFAAAPWWDVFHDDILRGLIDEAIANNYDLRTAVYRVEAAQHQVGITRSPLFPQASYQGGAQRGEILLRPHHREPDLQHLPWAASISPGRSTSGVVSAAPPRRRWPTCSPAEDVRRGVVLSLVSSVAQAYFELQDLDLQLEIAQHTTESFRETEALFTRRYEGGVDSLLSVQRAKAALDSTAATVPQLSSRSSSRRTRSARCSAGRRGPSSASRL